VGLNSKQKGFTLIEIVVVFVMIGLILGMVGTRFYGNLESVKVRNAGRNVMTALRYTRGQAVISREEKTLDVNVEEKTFKAPGKDPVELPSGVELSLRTATSEIANDSVGSIRFFPDGSSTGGRITLSAGQREWRINVAWLTGEIELNND